MARLDCLCSFKGRISSRYLTRMRVKNQGGEFKFTTNVVDSKVLFSILYHDQCFKTRTGPAGRPGPVAGPGLSKK